MPQPAASVFASILFIGVLIALGQTEPAQPEETATTQPAATTRPSGPGIIRGRVTIDGGSLFHKPDLSRVVVYLASNEVLDEQAGPAERATVSQRNKSFVPNFLVVPLGTEVEFPNWDKFDHNVFSRSAAAPAFDLDRYPYGQSKIRRFEKLGVVQVFCNIHPNMRAVVYVTPNGFAARADAKGNFAITGFPPGSYEIVAWHDRCAEQRQPITVTAEAPTEITFELKESRERVLSATDDRKASYGVERGLGIKRERLDLPVVTDSHEAPPDSDPEESRP